ncbi:MAG: ImmA/IrrE family metallo-endopeptidase, partial [Bifidobacteriaceae bacterium]|nr:ImmA/IrrE family metallo-endopeptidase [Bifidobacteriaceae bacterium]
MDGDLGQRIARRIDALDPPVTRKSFADAVGLAPDALSRALSGKRGISSLELLRIAEVLDADMHELVTGEPDPRRVVLAARHDFDRDTYRRSVPSFEEDKETIENVRVAYMQSGLPPHRIERLPSTPGAMRERLGDDFARPFVARIESELGVDVVRVSELGTAYTATITGRSVIIIPAKGNWFRENWDLAHELAHLVGLESEDEANSYAAELLLPETLVRRVDWESASQQTVADFLWETGVSTEALRHRLSALGLDNERMRAMLDSPTQRLLRCARSWSHAFGDRITERMDAAATRRFPLELQEAH